MCSRQDLYGTALQFAKCIWEWMRLLSVCQMIDVQQTGFVQDSAAAAQACEAKHCFDCQALLMCQAQRYDI